MQARSEFSATAQNDNAGRGSNMGASSFKSKRPLAVIATPDLDLWAQLGPMLESTCQLRHADSLATAADPAQAGHAHDPGRRSARHEPRRLRADLRQPSQPGRHRDSRWRLGRHGRRADARRRHPGAGRLARRSRADAARDQRRGANFLHRRRAERGHCALERSSGGEEKSGKSPGLHDRHRRRGARRCGRRLVLHVQRFFRPDAGCRRYVRGACRGHCRRWQAIVDGCDRAGGFAR